MNTTEDLRRRALAGDLHALQALRRQGFFAAREAAAGYAVSHAQRRLWIVDQIVEGFGAYNIPIALELRGKLNAAALRAGLLAVIERHEALRTTFRLVEGEVRQFVNEEPILPWQDFDLSDDPAPEQYARAIAADHASQRFDLARGPLLRVALIKLAPHRHLLLFNIHHIVGDLASLRVLVEEVSAAYAAHAADRPLALPPLPVQYKDFAAWQSQLLAGAQGARHRSYWLDQLAAPLPTMNLPADFVRPPLKSFRGDVCRIDLAAGLTERLRQLGLRHGLTLFMVLTAILKVLLHRYCGQDDIVVGFAVAGRDHPDLTGQIGCFVNMLALRSRLVSDQSFLSVLECVRQTTLAAYEHQLYPFDKLVEELDLPRDMSRSPVFDVSISLTHSEEAVLRLGDVTVSAWDDGFAASKVDTSFDFYETGGGLELAIAYCTDLFSAERMRRMADHYVRLAIEATENPEQRIGRMRLMPAEEEHRVLVEFNRTDRPLPGDETIVDLFEHQASSSAIAVRFGDRRLAYAELNQQANRIAGLLKRYGAGPESMVGLFMEASTDLVSGFLGILKAGATYVPLDPANPSQRLAALLDDVRPAVILTQAALAERLPGVTNCPLLRCDTITESSAASGSSPRAAGPGNAAYAIFTSGSTGRPKAAVLLHRGLVNVAREQARMFNVGPSDRVLQFASLGFDASVFEMVMALASGATLCLAPREQLLPGPALLALLEREEITIVTLPPSALAALPDAALPRLRTITVAGESCPGEVVRRWAKGRAFFNLYGPTEATIWTTAERCEADGGTPTIGRPIGNTRVYLLDRHQQPVPLGVPGELCIAGIGLARHFLNRPELTARCFVRDLFDASPSARLYRTGDLARYRPDGALEFLGRIDDQVKLRGYRIELGEIEAILAEHSAVREAVVLARDGEAGNRRLVACVTGRPGAAPLDRNELRRFLRERLPDHMVPGAFIVLDEMPLTTNKKIDRRALSALADARPDSGADLLAPRDDLEWVLARFFAEVLRLECIGADSSFFELGGDSLLAARVVSQVRETFRADVTIPQLFRAENVAALAQTVRAALAAGRADKIAAAMRRLHNMSPAEKRELLSKRAVRGRHDRP
jgi:amino acid adenylation domain-containing protein